MPSLGAEEVLVDLLVPAHLIQHAHVELHQLGLHAVVIQTPHGRHDSADEVDLVPR